MSLKLSKSQEDAVSFIYETGQTYLVAPMGSGKSAVALHVIKELIHDGHIKKALIVAPLKVCQQVWCQEFDKWGSRLNVALATGTPGNRQKAITDPDVDVAVINFENMAWFFKAGYAPLFDMIVIDEVTKLKAGGAGFKALRKHIRDFNTRLVMSATPVEESWEGLFYPFFCVDNGAALGRNKQTFLQTYFVPDYNGFKWTIKPGADEQLFAKIKPHMILLPDYRHELPPLKKRLIKLPMPSLAKAMYEAMKKDFLVSGTTAANAAVMTGKLQQIACGFIYTDSGDTRQIHFKKILALNKLLEPTATGEKMVVVYQFEEERRRLNTLLDDQWLTFNIETWENTEIPYLAIHPRSAGHGLDLTRASTLVFMSPIWSRDLTQQTIGRVWRRGQTKTVNVFTLISEDTIEEQICARESDKAEHHKLLLTHLNN